MPYGYVYSGDKETENGIGIYQPDPDAAEVVEKIFLLAVDGNTPVKIAKCLNDEGIPTPGAYKNQTRNYGYQIKNGKSNLWVSGKIRDILQNEVYLGTYICHKISTTRPRESSWNDETEYLRNCPLITCAFDLSKSAQSALSSVGVPRYASFFRLACTNLSCVICTSYFRTVPKV